MKRIFRICKCFLFTSLFFYQNALGTENVLFSSFFAEKNLSSLNITCFFQDRTGHIWIGTHDGLNYFNGKTIKVFKHDYQNKNSLTDNLIVSVCEDTEGFIWIGTARGVSKLNPNLFTFENYYNDDKGFGLGYKMSLYVDKERTLWATAANSLYAFDVKQNKFVSKEFKLASGHKGDFPRLFSGIFEDSKKRYWITSNDQIYQYNPKTGIFTPFTTTSRKIFFYQVVEDDSGNLFCGSWEEGIYKLNTKDQRLEPVESTGHYICYAFQKINNESVLWYGGGLSAFYEKKGSISTHQHDNKNPYSIREGGVAALFVDNQNQLWIGYDSKGIQIVSPSNQIFRSVTMPQENMFTSLNCFLQTKTNIYVGGWHNYSLARLDSNYNVLKSWKTLIPSTSPNANNISDGWSDGKGNIWLTSSFGLIKLNEKNDKTELFKMPSSLSKYSHFLQLLPEGDSVLWLAGYFCGLTRFSINTKTFKNWGANQRILFWGITRDKDGIIWLANDSGVLTGFDPKSETFIEKKFAELTENSMYSYVLYDNVDNVIWVASTNGLLRVDRNTFKAKLFTEKDNLPTNQINSLQLDARHRLWIATNKGLCFYDEKQNVFKTFFQSNGLPDNVLTQLFKIKPNGELLIGYDNGFSILQTNSVPIALRSKSVTIDKVYESGRISPYQLMDHKKTIELNYDQNNLRIEFSSNDLINPEDNQLLFRLEGFDDKWRTAHNGIVNYSKLAPGKYLFHVSSINHAGLKPAQEDYLSIIILPPVWKRTWFILLVSLLLFLLTVFVARYIFTRNLREKILILEKEHAIEKERSRISQDMHDELGSGLTKISIMSEVAIAQLAEPEKTEHQLKNISSSSRELVDNLQDIIWILDSKNDSLENLCAYIREYIFKYFEPSEIQIEAAFPEKISKINLSEDQRRCILMVFKESFNNISKHSGCTKIMLSMQEKDGRISFSINDNGRGFDTGSVRNFANGLSNMKKRMEHINGTFLINSIPGKGTCSEFSFPV